MVSHQIGQKSTFRVKNLHVFVELKWKSGKIYVVVFDQIGQKCTFWRTHCRFLFGSRVKVKLILRGGILPERPEMYILTFRFAPLCETGVDVRVNFRGCISPERQKVYICRTHAIAVFCLDHEWKLGFKVRQKGQKCTFTVSNLRLFVVPKCKLGKIYLVAFHQKGLKCTFRRTNLHFFCVDQEWK